jgi:hypothetical protein
MKLERYFNKFRLISAQDPIAGVKYYPVAIGSLIRAGYMVGQNGSGYWAEITTLQGVISCGIAVTANTAAEAVANGTVNVGVIPINSGSASLQFAVPVAATDLITLAQVGLLYDLQAANNIDENDAITYGLGFRVDAIDVSAEAIVANTFGFAIGHFEFIAAN